MKFSKQNRKYLCDQLKSNISNILKIQIADFFKTQKVEYDNFCQKCQSLLGFNKCNFCTHKNEYEINQILKRNFTCEKKIKQQKKVYESMILCIDMSGSMNCSYPTRYQKINKDFVIRALGQKNYNTLASILTQAQVIKNFKGIEVLYNSGQSIKDIAYIFREQILRQKQMSMNKPKPSSTSQQSVQQITQYITRKQIIQIGISKYIQQLQKQKPNTLITVVYFNTNIQIPIDNFSDKLIIPGLNDKTLEEMIELGEHYADKIAIQPVSEIGEKLITNMTKTQAQGQTALTPAVAFTIGLAKKWKHDLHQIILVTDGLSNIGFGQTQQQLLLQQSKHLFKHISQSYAIPYSCVFNIISFEDCSIGYQVIDQLISKTGGIPYNICFSQEKNNQKVVNSQTIDYLKLEMVDGFCQGTKQFCYNTKISVKVSNKSVKINCPEEYKRFVKNEQKNCVSLELGIKALKDRFSFVFMINQGEQFEDQYVKFSAIVQYKRKNKKHYCLREQLISVRKGQQQQAVKDQSLALSKQIRQKLQIKRIQQQIFQDYTQLQQKINQNAQISQNIDPKLLQMFKLKKKHIDQYDKNTDKLTKDKRSMMSRRIDTYKRREVVQSEDEDEEDAGFL